LTAALRHIVGASTSDVTRILGCLQAGEAHAAEELLPLVYDELRKLAAHKLAGEPPGQTLQPTALVHEVWLRMQAVGKQDWQNRAQFSSAAPFTRKNPKKSSLQ
jgi:hypothetical protein